MRPWREGGEEGNRGAWGNPYTYKTVENSNKNTHKKLIWVSILSGRDSILSKPASSQEQEEEAGSQAESGLEPDSHVSQKYQTTHSSS